MTCCHIDVAKCKAAIAGREIDILADVAGIPREHLDGKHHPCPACGGVDRFRFDPTRLFAYCNQCFHRKNGDTIAAVMHFAELDFRAAAQRIGEYLSMAPAPKPRKPKQQPRAYPNAQAAFDAYARVLGRIHDTSWEYHDAAGIVCGFILRWNGPDGKQIRPVSRIGDGWICGAMPEPRPLYRLLDVAEAEQVFVTEGEKSAEAVWGLGLTATTSSGGAKASRKTDWAPLAGKDVVVLPDNDQPGEQYAQTVAEILRTLDPRPTVRIVRLPGLPEKGDAADFIEAMIGQPA